MNTYWNKSNESKGVNEDGSWISVCLSSEGCNGRSLFYVNGILEDVMINGISFRDLPRKKKKKIMTKYFK